MHAGGLLPKYEDKDGPRRHKARMTIRRESLDLHVTHDEIETQRIAHTKSQHNERYDYGPIGGGVVT